MEYKKLCLERGKFSDEEKSLNYLKQLVRVECAKRSKRDNPDKLRRLGLTVENVKAACPDVQDGDADKGKDVTDLIYALALCHNVTPTGFED